MTRAPRPRPRVRWLPEAASSRRCRLEAARGSRRFMPGDGVDADLLRAGLLALAEERAAAEVLEVHLLHHRQRAAVALRLPLRQHAEVRDLGRGEERRRPVGARRHAGAAPDARGGVHGAVGVVLGHRDGVAVRRAARVAPRRSRPPAMIRSRAPRSTTRSAQHRERRRAPRLDRDRVAVLEAPHVQLAGGGGLRRARAPRR